MVRLRRGRLLDHESRRRRAFFARHPYRFLLLHLSLVFSRAAGLGAPAARAALENVSVMQQAVQHGGDSGALERKISSLTDLRLRPSVKTNSRVRRYLPLSGSRTIGPVP
jgi:hypothetical protein